MSKPEGGALAKRLSVLLRARCRSVLTSVQGRGAFFIATALILAASLAPVIAIVSGASTGGRGLRALAVSVVRALSEPRNQRAFAFTLTQAAASALAALVVGLPGAWLVARYRFPGRRLLKALSALPFSMPPLLVVLAFVLYYGRSGYLNRALMGVFGLSEPPLGFLYSFLGIVLVHGFYNFPIVLQTVGEVWEGLPRDREEAARLLGAGRLRAFIAGTLPALGPAIAEATSLSFLFCFFSFAVVLVFGGLTGSTIEVEVYRRARIEADTAGASALALAETLLALAVVAFMARVEGGTAATRKAGSPAQRERPRGIALAALVAYGLFLLVFFVGPLAALAVQAFTVKKGMGGLGSLGFGNFASLLGSPRAPFLRSLRDTLSTALPASFLACLGGGFAALGLGRGRSAAGSTIASLPLAVSGIVAALGWSLLFPSGGRGLVVLALAFSALPFVAKSAIGALAALDREPSAAARTLGATRLRAALGVELPTVAPSLLAAGAFAFAIAAGDLNAPIMLGSGGFEPIPLLLYRLSSAYRFPEACAAGLLLGLLTVTAFLVKEGRRSDA